MHFICKTLSRILVSRPHNWVPKFLKLKSYNPTNLESGLKQSVHPSHNKDPNRGIVG